MLPVAPTLPLQRCTFFIATQQSFGLAKEDVCNSGVSNQKPAA